MTRVAPPDLFQETFERLPLHAKVRERLRHLMEERFEDGQKFFSEPVLVQRFGVALGTMRQALGDLTREGLLVRRVPQGTFVRKAAAGRLELRVVTPQIESVFLMGLLDKVVEECHRRNLPMRIHQTHRGESAAETLLLLDGAPTRRRILLLGELPRPARQLYLALSKRGFRVVNVDTLLPGCEDGYVGVDNERGIRLGMEHLASLGHRRIVLLVNEPPHRGNTQARVNSFLAFAREHRLAEARVMPCDAPVHGDAAIRASMRTILTSTHRPTAVFTVSDWGAWVALDELARRKLRVPADMSVLGFDDDRASAFMQPSLSTLAQPVAAIARRAVDFLVQASAPHGMVLLPPTLVVRESTGPAPAAKGQAGRGNRRHGR